MDNFLLIAVLFTVGLTTVVYTVIFFVDILFGRLTVWYCSRKGIIIDEEYSPTGKDWTVVVFDTGGRATKRTSGGLIVNTSCEGIYFRTKAEAKRYGVDKAKEYLKTKR